MRLRRRISIGRPPPCRTTNTGKEVDWSHVVKGYECKKGEFVALVDADFKHANVKASETIEIDTFCDGSQIPAMYYEKPLSCDE